jgi:hypothetical protein
MSLSLAMSLMAGLVVPGDVPEKVPGNVAEPQPLDLRGEWKGTFRNYHGVCAKVQVGGGRLKSESNTTPGEIVADVAISFTDEGNGKFRLRLNNDDVDLGIYRQTYDCFIGCFSDKYRPTEFKLAERQALLILHRVKPSK